MIPNCIFSICSPNFFGVVRDRLTRSIFPIYWVKNFVYFIIGRITNRLKWSRISPACTNLYILSVSYVSEHVLLRVRMVNFLNDHSCMKRLVRCSWKEMILSFDFLQFNHLLFYQRSFYSFQPLNEHLRYRMYSLIKSPDWVRLQYLVPTNHMWWGKPL